MSEDNGESAKPDSPKRRRRPPRLSTADRRRKEYRKYGVHSPVVGAPLEPTVARDMYRDVLTPYEMEEILSVPKVYYVGESAEKIPGDDRQDVNYGLDTSDGEWIPVIHDHIDYRYEVLSVLGRGSFGVVLRVFDHRHKCMVALKIGRRLRKTRFQAVVEVKILEHLMNNDPNHCSSVVRVFGYFTFRRHICISFELLSLSMYDLLRNNSFRGFSMALIRRFAAQLVVCLNYLSHQKVIHGDLKPENILLRYKTRAEMRVIDFGSACFEDQTVFSYLQSRFYRAPEVIFGMKYNRKIDMWSMGCVLCELFLGYPIFPGKDEKDQVARLIQVLGLPPAHIMSLARRRAVFWNKKGEPYMTRGRHGKLRVPDSVSLRSILRRADSDFISFIARCLAWDPRVRMSAEEAAEHPYLKQYVSFINTSIKLLRKGKKVGDGAKKPERGEKAEDRRSSVPKDETPTDTPPQPHTSTGGGASSRKLHIERKYGAERGNSVPVTPEQLEGAAKMALSRGAVTIPHDEKVRPSARRPAPSPKLKHVSSFNYTPSARARGYQHEELSPHTGVQKEERQKMATFPRLRNQEDVESGRECDSDGNLLVSSDRESVLSRKTTNTPTLKSLAKLSLEKRFSDSECLTETDESSIAGRPLTYALDSLDIRKKLNIGSKRRTKRPVSAADAM